MKLKVTLLFALVLVILCSLPSYASSVKNFNIMPDSPLYPLDRAYEQFRFFWLSPEDRVEYRLYQAEERIQEATEMASRNRPDLSRQAVHEAYYFVLNSIDLTPAIASADPAPLEKIRKYTVRVRKLLREML